MTTEHGSCHFTVKEGDCGRVFIALKSAGQPFIVAEGGLLHINLHPDRTLAQAQEFARALNENVEKVGYTE